MKTIAWYIAFMIALPWNGAAQFITQGKIAYERKTNQKLQVQTEEDNEWAKSIINKLAQYTISEFEMSFSSEASEYEFTKEQEAKGVVMSWLERPGSKNKVHTDFRTGKVMTQKQVYENAYLVEDSIKHFQWKLESDTRIIAGYPCRKAVTRICDSVVVVAFYSDQIMVSGGPEGFGGLPGMILGLVVPRLYTSWFATQVEAIPTEVKVFEPAKKSKKVAQEELIAVLRKSTKGWGNYSTNLIWWLTL